MFKFIAQELNPPSYKRLKITTVPSKLRVGSAEGSFGLVLLLFTGLKLTFNPYSC